jgi:hypothetical protein
MEKTPVGVPTLIDIPNEITLAQLVTYFILPAGGDWDVNMIFYWCFEEIENNADRKREIIEVPNSIPTGFVLRVKANTLRDAQDKRMARCIYGSIPMCFMIEQNATIAQLRARMIDWLTQRNQGDEWKFEWVINEGEAIDFDHVYAVVPLNTVTQLPIFLRQRPVDVSPSESWINVSDRVVRALGLPLGTLFRIFPVVGDVEDRDPDDCSYSITWEAGKQYWFDIVYDEGKDRHGRAKEVRMVDPFNRVDTLVVPSAANMREIVEIWRSVMEIPDEIQIGARSGNGREIFWGYRTAEDTIPCTLPLRDKSGR